ncbi:hypothetical protein glysoja_020882 [Glycine soja]|nr:hypothetical protein glysoja_020882 [Glycine soja]
MTKLFYLSEYFFTSRVKIKRKTWFQIGEKEERARESRNGALRLFLTVTGARTLCSSDS